jgi:uncharacterized membrane protein
VLFTLVLVVATLVAWGAGARAGATWQDHARRGLALAMVVAGVGHLAQPDPFVQHLPDWVPGRLGLVYLSGAVEIALGAALFALSGHRATVGRLLALFFLAVWPANIYVAVAAVDVDGQPGGAYPWIRLPFQILYIAWALWSTRPPTADRADQARLDQAAVPAAAAR